MIVGGTGGIGLAAARRFLDEGARVVISGQTAEEVAAARTALPGSERLFADRLDLLSPGAVDDFFAEAASRLGGRIDVLFHVAGISGRRFGDGPLHDCSEDGWDRVHGINARGAFLTNRAAVRAMLRQPVDGHGLRGTVLNLGSVLARSPAPEFFGTIAYAASKGAVESLTLAAAAQYAPDRIRFNLIVPGLIDTPMAARAVSDPAIRRYLEGKQAIRGGPGTADDVGEAALFLCEPASRFVTGAVLRVDGGWSLGEGRT